MKVSLLTVVALATVALCSAADPECVYRRIRGLSVHWADPTSCGRFYRCAKGSKREVICPQKKVYNQETGKCVARRRGICKLSLAAPLVGEDNICAAQVSGAYVPQPDSCRNFYICNNNEAYPQTCDPGSYFNQTTSNCVPDTETTCWQNKCIGQPDGTYMPDSTSCLSFLICEKNDAIKQYCDSGSYYNTTNNNCQPDPDSTHCSENLCAVQPNGTYVKDITDCHGFFVCLSSKAIKQQCPEGSYFDWISLNCRPGNCPSDETTTEICTDEPTTACTDTPTPPSSTECSEDTTDSPSTECSDDTPTPPSSTECSEDTTDSPSTECSDDTPTPPSSTECSEDTTDSPSTECSDDTPTPPSSTECSESATSPPSQETCTCPGGYANGELLPYPNNCMLYYICSDKVLVEHSCHIGNYFEPTIRVCMPDTNGVCPQCSATYRAKRSVEETELTDSEEFSCFGIYREGQLVKDPKDCRTFQLCYEGNMMLQDCGAGNYFDEYDNVCKVDAESACGANGLMNNAVAVQAAGADDCTCPGGYAQGSMVPHPTTCDQYYICNDSRLQLQTCGVGKRFDSISSACVLDTGNSCWPANVCKDKPDNTLVPDPNNCAAFFMCKKGVGYLGDCDEGQWFNPQNAACEPDHGGHCINPCANTTGILFLPHPDCSKFYFCNNGTSHLENCTVGGFDVTVGYCHVNAVCEATMCKGLEDGTTFEVVGDPDKFYLCMNGIADIYNCLPNTAYNPNVGVCLSHPSTNCDQQMCKNGTDINAFPPIKQNSENTDFCYCREKGAYINQCQHGYTFNANLGVCYSNAPCDPELCYDQPEYWVSVNRNSTESFCLCVMKDQINVDCPGNATFNPRTLLCQLPAEQDPRCNPTYCLQHSDYTIFPALNTTQGFCMCQDMGSKYIPCGAGKLFNKTIGICMPNENAGSCDLDNCKTGNTFFPVPTDPTSFCYCVSDTKVIIEKCPAGQAFSPEWLVCLEQTTACNVEFCKSPANVILPAFNDPHSFCYCANATTVIKKSCPVGTIFNPSKLICLEDPCDKQFCKIAANDGRPFPADNYTQGFCLCQNGVAALIPCDPGSIFDTTHEVCLPIADVECDIKLCVNASSENAYPIPAINDPTSFCYCLAPNLVKKFECPPNNIFDYDLGICVNANGDPNAGNCTCPGGYQEGQFLPNPTNCQMYYICAAGKLIVRDCGTGNFFNEATGKCEPDTKGACLPTDGCTCVGAYREGDVIAHPTSKQFYFMCYNTQLHEGDCGVGNVFDDSQKTCVSAKTGRTVPIQMRSKVSDKAVAVVDGEADAEVENVRSFKLLTNFVKKLTQAF